ncbi:hypothetical protein O181_008459 [Austropuccinia psidii MF-1]|uniref:Uncharacterized protein n=1 Tax=Austropuccinia psidii MF-1 TaxID=1389203 RepID=A0A9Q3GIW1_9BASI|nr:hypothetical protein [Austropuccinia psidii MF-1]
MTGFNRIDLALRLIDRPTKPLPAPVSLKQFRRHFSASKTTHQARQRLRPVSKDPIPRRPCLDADNQFFPMSALIGTQWRPPVEVEESWRFPIAVPQAVVDSDLIRKIKGSKPEAAENQLMEPTSVLKVRQDGQNQLEVIAEDWVRNELNVMGTIREETIQIFMKLLLHPSTLAPISERLKLRTAGRRVPARASLHPPARLVPPSTHADLELTQLLYYFIGAIYHSLPSDGSPPEQLKSYVINFIKNGLPHTSPRELLIRASRLSGQATIGIKKGYARAEIRVAQLSIWGEKRSKKLKKLVPDQKCHRTPLRMRKAALLKQRWVDEEKKMIHWRRRLLMVTAVQEAEKLNEKLRKEENLNLIKSQKESNQMPKMSSEKPNLFDRLLKFWKN